MTLRERAAAAAAGADRSAVVLSANPMHDTGGGQRSAQLALELLDRGFAVLFVSHGKVTETVDLGIHFDQPRLLEAPLGALAGADGLAALDSFLAARESIVVTQVPVRTWEPALARARAAGAVTVYDCIDLWDSELGRGWYRRAAEERIARGSDLLVASAPELVQHVELIAEREAHLLPNAYNSRVFRADVTHPRPADLPEDGRVALYVGALWGGWLDWDLVRRAAEALPETRFVFVGDHRKEGRGLPASCVFLGLKPQRSLPGYLAHADVAFLPWGANSVTRATSPLKVYEFVAMGLPVVAPAIETLREIPGVALAEGADRFVGALREKGRAALTAEEREAMAAFATRSSWVRRVDNLLELTLAGRVAARETGGASVPDDPRSARATRRLGGRAPGGGSISVVIPAYNHERHVGPAVDSVRAQTLPAGELVVVDDGSTDGTHDVLLARRFDAIRIVRQENRGAHAALNRGVALATGDWVAILNSDDVFLPERLEHAWGVARTTGAALVVGSVRMIDDTGAPLAEDHDSQRWYREARAESVRSRSLRRALLRHNFAVTTSNFFLHKELWRRLGGFSAYRYAHDLDFILRALELCSERVSYADEVADVLYRVHPHNTILENVPRALEERAALLRRLRSPTRRARALLGRRAARRRVTEAVDTSSLSPVARVAAGLPVGPRLGLVVTSLDEGGLEELVGLLAQSLPAQGLEVGVLCTHAGGAVAARLAQVGAPVTVAGGSRAEWRRWAERLAPDVISTHFVDEAVVRELAELGTPVVETVHNTYAWLTEEQWERERRKHALLAATVAVSRLVAEYHARHIGASPTPHVIPNAVHPARLASVPRAWARRHYALPAEAPVLLHLGRMTLQKNLDGVLGAFADVLERVPDARLVLAGGTGERAYEREVRRAHRRLLSGSAVQMLPHQAHPGALLSGADAYVSNSFFEGWSMAASEALWLGVPLVLSECGGSAELVGGRGERGRVVPNPLGDPLQVTWAKVRNPAPAERAANRGALAEAVVDVIAARDAWAERRSELRAYAHRELSPGRLARAYADLVRRLVR